MRCRGCHLLCTVKGPQPHPDLLPRVPDLCCKFAWKKPCTVRDTALNTLDQPTQRTRGLILEIAVKTAPIEQTSQQKILITLHLLACALLFQSSTSKYLGMPPSTGLTQHFSDHVAEEIGLTPWSLAYTSIRCSALWLWSTGSRDGSGYSLPYSTIWACRVLLILALGLLDQTTEERG